MISSRRYTCNQWWKKYWISVLK